MLFEVYTSSSLCAYLFTFYTLLVKSREGVVRGSHTTTTYVHTLLVPTVLVPTVLVHTVDRLLEILWISHNFPFIANALV